jgi:hypothetical protein
MAAAAGAAESAAGAAESMAAASSGAPEAAPLPPLLSRLAAVRDEVVLLASREQASLALLARRARHLARSASTRPPVDLDLACADHLLRHGFTAAADALIRALPDPETALLLLDREVHVDLNRCADALGRARDIEPALAWAHAHASRLRRIGSPLEFALRRQAFVELLREGGRRAEAATYAALHLAPLAQAAVQLAAAQPPAPAGGLSPSPSPSSPPELALALAAAAALTTRSLQVAMSALAFPDPLATCGSKDVADLFAEAE